MGEVSSLQWNSVLPLSPLPQHCHVHGSALNLIADGTLSQEWIEVMWDQSGRCETYSLCLTSRLMLFYAPLGLDLVAPVPNSLTKTVKFLQTDLQSTLKRENCQAMGSYSVSLIRQICVL